MQHDVLLKMAGLLNNEGIRWALGASYALHFYGLVEQPRDIDIIVDAKDIKRTIELLSEFGKLEEEPPKGDYLTEYFYYFNLFGSEVDVISNFKLRHENGIYTYIFDDEAIAEKVNLDGEMIPLAALEDWYVLYLVMHNKKGRGDLLEDWFNRKGMQNRELIKRALEQPLTESVRKRINKTIKAL